MHALKAAMVYLCVLTWPKLMGLTITPASYYWPYSYK